MNKSFFLNLSAIVILAACAGKNESTQKSDSLTIASDSAGAVNTSIVVKDPTIPVSIDEFELSKEFNYKGLFKEAFVWEDGNGKNVLVLSTLKTFKGEDEKQENEEEEKTAEIFAVQYVVREEKTKPEILWELRDFEKDCIFDLTSDFIFSPVLTDLDNDQIKESFIAYKLACRSDVSPARMKIVVHEDKNKYALRGLMYIKMNQEGEQVKLNHWEPDLSKMKVKQDDYAAYWGRYENAKDFQGAPPAFFDQALTLWMDNFIEQ